MQQTSTFCREIRKRNHSYPVWTGERAKLTTRPGRDSAPLCNIPKAKVDLYAGVHGNQLDTPGAASVDDIYAVVVGTKLKLD